MHDLIIKGGNIVDGSGAPAFIGDIAIDEGKISAVGTIDAPAKESIDANGLLVTPGWVDTHTHYDGQATWDPPAHTLRLARRHHRDYGQLRCRLCPGGRGAP